MIAYKVEKRYGWKTLCEVFPTFTLGCKLTNSQKTALVGGFTWDTYEPRLRFWHDLYMGGLYTTEHQEWLSEILGIPYKNLTYEDCM
jgi:hypothetical protein